MLKQRYDIVIAGGGMVGISLAISLATALQRLSILVVESFPLDRAAADNTFQPSFDARSTALSASSRDIFQCIGIWEQLAPGVCPIETIHVSNRGRAGSTLMDAVHEGMPALGYVVENQWLGRVLLERLQSLPQIAWCAPAVVEGLQIDGGRRVVGMRRGDDPLQVETELLIVVDGARSKLARSLGVAYAENDYGHSAVIANVLSDRAHQGRAFERFTDQGPLALLPLKQIDGRSRSALVWTMPTERARQLLDLDDPAFLQALQSRFGYRLGNFDRVGQRHSYPLKLVEAREQVRTGVAIMGNAAHTLHPVAGQGFNLALRDVAQLVDVLLEAGPAGQRPGDLAVLQTYLARQRWDQRKTSVFSDRVSTLFALGLPGVAGARDMGLSVLDVWLPAKSWFVRQATGLGGPRARWRQPLADVD